MEKIGGVSILPGISFLASYFSYLLLLFFDSSIPMEELKRFNSIELF